MFTELETKLKHGVQHKVRLEKMKTRRVGIKNENPDSFPQRCLDPEDPRCTADEYFKEISYIIDLNGKTLMINVESIREKYNGCKYLLQIWQTQTKTKVYEQPLKNPLRNWAICQNTFVMIYQDEEADNDCIHLINCLDLTKMQVKSFGLENDVKYIAYKNDKIFAVSMEEVRFAPLANTNFGQAEAIEISQESIRLIKPGCRLHGILMNNFSFDDDCLIVAFETPDNQIDFNMLYANNVEVGGDYSYKWEQYRIVNPRKNHNAPDPIKKMVNVFFSGFSFCVSLRKSGLIDIYWNMARRDSPKVKIADIGMSIGAFYFKLEDGTYQYFKHKNLSNISYSMSESITDEEIDFDNIHLKIVNQYVKLYSGFKILSKNETFVIVSHGKFISIYNIEQQKWINHLYFEKSDIFDLLSRCDNGWSDNASINVDVLLNNGEFYQDALIDMNRQESFTVPSIVVTGTPLRVHQDKFQNSNYNVVFNDDFYKIRMFKEYSLNEIVINKYDNSNSSRNLVPIQTIREGDDRYFVLQNSSSVSIYSCSMYDTTYITLRKHKEFQNEYISGQIHSAISYDIKNHLFIFDEKNLYIFMMDKEAEKIPMITDIYAIGVQFFNKQVSYVLSQDTPENLNPGLRLLDMESTLKKKKCNLILLKNIDFGIQRNFEYSEKTGRLCFQRSLSELIICPLLHQNSNKLLGADEKDSYLLSKRSADRLITFTKAGQLTTWNLVTGKHVCTHQKDELATQLSPYEISTTYKNIATLINWTETVSTMKDEQFFDSWQLLAYGINQATYLKRCDHEYRRWKILEIQSETEVKVIMEFTFPYFQQGTTLYINEKRDRLILKIVNYRTFIYKIVKFPGPTQSNEVYFELIRQIVDYPNDLENASIVTQALTFFSPCFSRFIKIDRRTNQFLIQDTITDQLVKYMPKDIMFLSRNGKVKVSSIINRVKWLDYSLMLIVNEEGIEKIVDIDKDFNEVAYNARPLFNEICDGEDKEEFINYVYYYKRKILKQDDVLSRLKRIYQDYKSDYYLYKKKSFAQFYETLFDVDQENNYYNSQSFTFLHWSIIEQLLRKKIKIKDLEDSVIEQLLYNILPGGNTVLHLLCTQEKQLMRIFEEAHKDEMIRFHVPFLPNILGESPIHRCLDKQDLKSVDTILKYLKHYPADHHSRAIKDKIGLFLKQQLPGFIEYIDTRFYQTEQLKRFNKGGLKNDMSGIITSELWFKEEDFYKTIMDKDQMETRIKCEFIDLPGIYHYLDPDFQSFFDQLAITENLDYFNSRTIQKMVDFNYPLVRLFVVIFLFLPFCAFHILFVVYANVIYENRDKNQSYKNANLGVSIALLVFSAYFMLNEIRQFFREGIDYIISVWNYIDLIAPIGVIFTIILQLLDFSGKNIDENMLRCVFAVTTLFMWMKLLYFLRIFKRTGYLIRLVVEVVGDMGIFLLVLLITVTAFGDCLLRFSLSNSVDKQFIVHTPAFDTQLDELGNDITPLPQDLFFFAIAYTYRALLGDFDTSNFGKVATPLVWVIWALHMLFNMIVMLNLLISIIGSTYERVVDNQEQAGYQEQACLIAENQHLIPTSFKRSYAVQGKYLVQVTDLEKVAQDENQDPVTERLDELRVEIEMIQSNLKNQGLSIKRMLMKLDRQFPDPAEVDDVQQDQD